MSGLEKVAIEFITCAYCGAEPKTRCFAPKSGRRAPFQHSVRTKAVYAAWRVGYFDARRDFAYLPTDGLVRAQVSAQQDEAWWQENKPDYCRDQADSVETGAGT